MDQYLDFNHKFNKHYKLSSKLFDHSQIVLPKYRAKLFQWLSEECSKQRINRMAYVLTCTYVDLYFIKGGDVKKKQDYQYLALGALILACKQVQRQGKVPLIKSGLINPNILLKMQNSIIQSMDYYLNPPNYIQILNNIAKIWDVRCNRDGIYPTIRYMDHTMQGYKKIKTIYEIMDCLYLFHEMLDYDIYQIVLTAFYLLTKIFHLQQQKILTEQKEFLWKSIPDEFQKHFASLLNEYDISTKINNQIINKIIKIQDLQISKTPQNLPEYLPEQIIQRVTLLQTYNLKAYQKAQIYYEKEEANKTVQNKKNKKIKKNPKGK